MILFLATLYVQYIYNSGVEHNVAPTSSNFSLRKINVPLVRLLNVVGHLGYVELLPPIFAIGLPRNGGNLHAVLLLLVYIFAINAYIITFSFEGH